MDPMTIIAGAKLAAASVDLALDAAEGAAKRIRRAMKVGSEFADIAHDVGAFFSAQGEAEAAAKKQEDDKRAAKLRGEKPPEKDALSQAFDNVMRVRKLREFETELREWMIWTGNGDFYQELIDERARIVSQREHDRLDEIKEQKRIVAAAVRRKERRNAAILDALAVIVGICAILTICYGMWWMFTYNDRH